MNSKEYWNMVAKDKKFSTPFQMDIYKEYVDKDKKILDIGCGYGRTLKELYDNGYTNLLGIIALLYQFLRKGGKNHDQKIHKSYFYSDRRIAGI